MAYYVNTFGKRTVPIPSEWSPRLVPFKRFGTIKFVPTVASIPNPFETDSALEALLRKKVVRHCIETQKTLHECRWHVLCQVADWLQVSHVLDTYEDEIPRQRLLTLLLNDIKCKNIKQLPQNESEWTRQLTLWLRQNTSEIKNRTMCRLLAVDGFEGLEPKYLKFYLKNVLNPSYLRREYRIHLMAVRKMYEWFDSRPEVSCLTGTDSGCIVFLALLQLYGRELKHVMMNDQVARHVDCAREWVENFLYRNVNYYKDVHNVTEELLGELGQSYKETWKGQPGWEQVGQEKLQGLDCTKYNE